MKFVDFFFPIFKTFREAHMNQPDRFKRTPTLTEVLENSRTLARPGSYRHVEGILSNVGAYNVKVESQNPTFAHVTYSGGPPEAVVQDLLEQDRPTGTVFVVKRRPEFSWGSFLWGFGFGVGVTAFVVGTFGCDGEHRKAGLHYEPQNACEVFTETVCSGLDMDPDDCTQKLTQGWEWVDTTGRHHMLGACRMPASKFECYLAAERNDEARIFETCSIDWDVI